MENTSDYEKPMMTIEEATKFYGIGEHKLRELTAEKNCRFVLYVGRKRLIKRKLFEEFLENAYSI